MGVVVTGDKKKKDDRINAGYIVVDFLEIEGMKFIRISNLLGEFTIQESDVGFYAFKKGDLAMFVKKNKELI